MNVLAAVTSVGPPDALFAFFGLFWCCGLTLGLSQIVLFIVALVQILSRNMPTDAKVLWCLVSWIVPVVGPILWWTIGAKQNPPGGPQGSGGGLGGTPPPIPPR